MDKVNIIGLGYIGLPTALMFAANDVEVVGTDHNKKVIDTLNSGRLTFSEEGLDTLFQTAVSNGITFTSEYITTDFYIIAVPTPYVKENKRIDPKYVITAIKSILDVCAKGAIIIIESTISPGTIDRFIRPLFTERGMINGVDIHLVHAPERIMPGRMMFELENNPRTIGADSKLIAERVKALYSTFCKSEIVLTDIKSAEMIKVIENTYRDINIAFANELAKICHRDNMNVYEIIKNANKHPRVNILQPGPGVGGHCISVDPWFLVGDYPDLVNIILAARNINDEMPEYVIKRMRNIMKENNIRDITRIGIYGITYKEDIDDIRESPTLQLLERLDDHLAVGIKCYDPLINHQVVEHQFFDFDLFLENIDLLVILVAHTHLKENIKKIKSKVIFDTRNIGEINNAYKL